MSIDDVQSLAVQGIADLRIDIMMYLSVNQFGYSLALILKKEQQRNLLRFIKLQ